MPEKPVISNNSPLVALWHLDLLSLLRDLYTEIWIPQETEGDYSFSTIKPQPILAPPPGRIGGIFICTFGWECGGVPGGWKCGWTLSMFMSAFIGM